MGLVLSIGLAVAACTGDSTSPDPTSTTSQVGTPGSTTSMPPPTTSSTTPVDGLLPDFERAIIEVGGVPYTVAVADTNDRRRRGLMGVEDLSPLDGMLFVFDEEAVRSFWMKDTLLPLDIAFFDAAGVLVHRTSMVTCPDGDCPTYSSEEPARYALEAPAGSLAGLAADARLVLIDGLDGSGKEI